jgi:hypothetical protein
VEVHLFVEVVHKEVHSFLEVIQRRVVTFTTFCCLFEWLEGHECLAKHLPFRMIELEMTKLFVLVVDKMSDFKLKQRRAVDDEEPAVLAS